MQLTAIVILGLYTLQINAAAIAKRSDQVLPSASASASRSAQKSPMPTIDYNANKNYVPYQKLNDDMTLAENDAMFDMDEEEEREMTSKDYTRPHHSLDEDESHIEPSKKYGVTDVGSRKYRYRDSTSSDNPNPILVVPMKQDIDNGSKPLPRRKQKNLIGVDDHGHVRHVVLDSNKDEKEDDVRKIRQKDIVAVDDQGEQYTMVVPMTTVPGGRK